MAFDPGADPLLDEILDVLARETRVDRTLLRKDLRADELDIASLDLALAFFELEDRYDLKLPDPAPGAPQPTVGDIVEQGAQALAQRAEGGATAADR